MEKGKQQLTTDKNRLNSASANLLLFDGTGYCMDVFHFSISITPVLGTIGMSEQEQVIRAIFV